MTPPKLSVTFVYGLAIVFIVLIIAYNKFADKKQLLLENFAQFADPNDLSNNNKNSFQFSDKTYEETFLENSNLTGFTNYAFNKYVTAQDIAILKKTLNFMMENRDAEDPELVSFVRTLIVDPFPGNQRALSTKTRTDFSQSGRSKYVDALLASKRYGFYVEAGGYDGETHSNSLFFELERDWNGILIEAVKPLFNKLIRKRRSAYAINACVSDRVQIGKMRFFPNRKTDTFSGLESEMNKDRKIMGGPASKIIFTPCFSLVTILKAININRVDYVSLDVEGLTLKFFEIVIFKAI